MEVGIEMEGGAVIVAIPDLEEGEGEEGMVVVGEEV